MAANENMKQPRLASTASSLTALPEHETALPKDLSTTHVAHPITPPEEQGRNSINLPPLQHTTEGGSPQDTTATDDSRTPQISPMQSSALPPLNYTLRTRKRSIAFFWTLILIDCIGVPIGLYFGLWYGLHVHGKMSANAVFSISTGCLGGVSIVEYFVRFWRLFKKGSTCRVLHARRWYLDWFHWNFSAAWFFIMCELIIGTVFDDPPIRVLAMPVASLLFWFSFQLLVEETLRHLKKPAPIRISSVSKGSPMRPGIYSIIEDVVAVDGSGGQTYRAELNARFEASHLFRQMLDRLSFFWAFGALGAAVATTILVWTLERDAAYVVGWVLPFLWAGVWATATIPYVQRCLRHEKEMWNRPKV
ncbi:hypothetical protein MRB53_039882 [Persea americana]|nr:hypothetical protein MRB53_039882 [Persea americana]